MNKLYFPKNIILNYINNILYYILHTNCIMLLNQLYKRIPQFELSYEVVSHKKVFTDYPLAIAIPLGKKYISYFSFDNTDDVCYMIELNRDKKMIGCEKVDTLFDPICSIGTILYGTLISAIKQPEIQNKISEEEYKKQNEIFESSPKFFIIEDILLYKGISLRQTEFSIKLGYIESLLKNYLVRNFSSNKGIVFILPYMWSIKSPTEEIIINSFNEIKQNIFYNTHHIQVRHLNIVAPYININIENILNKINKKDKIENEEKLYIKIQKMLESSKLNVDYSKQQYKFPTIFEVKADIDYDIYELYAYGENGKKIFYDNAYIPNYKVSVFMNKLFRFIRENDNLDFIEESDDDSDFQDISESKYVDLNKTLKIECEFSFKFKRWIPLLVIDNARVVHINKLISNYNSCT